MDNPPLPDDRGAYKVRMWQHRLPMAQAFSQQTQETVMPMQYSSTLTPSFGQLATGDPSHTVFAAPQPTHTIVDQQMWEGYVQEKWNDRRTVPADLSKFRSPSNVRGAPMETEATPSKYAGWSVHDRMGTMESIASTNWDPSFAGTYSFVDPLRRDSEPAFSMSSMHIGQMSSPTVLPAGSSGHTKRWLTSSMPQPLPTLYDPHSYQAPQHFLPAQPQLKDYFDDGSFLPAFTVDQQPDSRRASTATSASSVPLLSPQSFFHQPSGPLIYSDPSAPGFLLETRDGSSYCDYFSLDPHAAPILGIPSLSSACLPPDLAKLATALPSLTIDAAPRASPPLIVPTPPSAIKRARLHSVGDANPVTRSHARSTLGQKTTSSSSLRIPATVPEVLSSDEQGGQSRPAAYRRLSSPVTSIRPPSTDTEGSQLLDGEDSGEEEEDAEGEREDSLPFNDAEYIQPSVLQRVPTSNGNAYETATAYAPFTSASRPRLQAPSGSGVSDDMVPRKQKLRFADDMYTPLWVRGSATAKEGLCDMCPAGGRWLQLKNSAFWYHKQFTHGVSSVSGTYFAQPVETRRNIDNANTEGLCHQCNVWVTHSTRRQDANGGETPPTLWYKHAHKCHCYVTKAKTATFQRVPKVTSKKRRSESIE